MYLTLSIFCGKDGEHNKKEPEQRVDQEPEPSADRPAFERGQEPNQDLPSAKHTPQETEQESCVTFRQCLAGDDVEASTGQEMRSVSSEHL